MQKNTIILAFTGFVLMILLTSCDKGYKVRFTNYYIEPIDSVVIGNDKIVYKAVKIAETTDFRALSKGKYTITCVSAGKKRLYSSITIPGNGKGKRTIQLDGIKQFSILEE